MPKLPEADRLAHYHLLEQLGKGTYGTCYKACKPPEVDVLLVVKVVPLAGLSPRDVDDSYREALLLSQLHHPHIVRYRDAWVERSHLYIVTDFCAGGDLAALIQAHQPLPEAFIWPTILQVARGLEYLHRNRILHRRAPTLAHSTRDLSQRPASAHRAASVTARNRGARKHAGRSAP